MSSDFADLTNLHSLAAQTPVSEVSFIAVVTDAGAVSAIDRDDQTLPRGFGSAINILDDPFVLLSYNEPHAWREYHCRDHFSDPDDSQICQDLQLAPLVYSPTTALKALLPFHLS
jgi:hypothetical protein